MAKQMFIPRNFEPQSLKLIGQANQILAEYEGNNIRITVRGLYYRFIGLDLFPESWRDKKPPYSKNNKDSYKKFVDLMGNAREAGRVDWDSFEDRGRIVVYPSHWETPAGIIRSAWYSFRLDKWVGQQCHVELMAEKDAVTGILEPLANEYDIRFTANRGFTSKTALYNAGKRMRRAVLDGKEVHVLYVGDHDASGMDMSRDIRDRIYQYSEMDESDITINRVVLNMDQVLELNPPPNPVKQTDSRAKPYIAKYGDEMWEVDAVEALEMRRIVENAITELIDTAAWDEVVAKEAGMKSELYEFMQKYEKPDGRKPPRKKKG